MLRETNLLITPSHPLPRVQHSLDNVPPDIMPLSLLECGGSLLRPFPISSIKRLWAQGSSTTQRKDECIKDSSTSHHRRVLRRDKVLGEGDEGCSCRYRPAKERV